jgi:ketosteroid isomerase-like protein
MAATAGTLLLMVSTSARADKATDNKKAIRAIYEEWDKAFVRKDIKGMLKHNSPDSVYIGTDGKSTGATATIEQIQEMFDRAESLEIKTEITSFTPAGDTATVEIHQRFSVFATKKNGIKGSFTTDGTQRDYWVQKGNNWLRKRQRLLELNLEADGKPLTPPSGSN